MCVCVGESSVKCVCVYEVCVGEGSVRCVCVCMRCMWGRVV